MDLKSIGLFALIQLPYTWKFLWSPLMDRYAFPALGRRRGWMLVTQLLLLAAIPAFGQLHPTQDLWAIAYLAAAVAFFSASQDIVLDAYRREILPDVELGLGNAIHVNAYRVSSLIPGCAGADPRGPSAVVERLLGHRGVHAARYRHDDLPSTSRAAGARGRGRSRRR